MLSLRHAAVRRLLAPAALLLTVAALPADALAGEATPAPRAVTIVYPFAPGGIGDTSSRIFAEYLKKYLGTEVIVENKPGAGGAIGAAAVKQSKPDGYTLLSGGASALVYTPLTEENVPYDPLKDFRPIGFVDSYQLMMVTGKPTGFTSVKSVLDAARVKPMVYGATGNGTSPNLAAQWLAKVADVQMEPANYKGTAPALPDAMAGRIPFIFMSPQTASTHLKSGTLIALAITSNTRDKQYPDVPTFTEAGFPAFNRIDWAQWNGVFAPAGVPAERMQVLNEAVRKALADPGLQERYAKLGTAVYAPMTLEQADEFYRTQFEQWHAATRELGINKAK